MTSTTETWFKDDNPAVNKLKAALRSEITWLVFLIGCYSSGKSDLVRYCVEMYNKSVKSADDEGSSQPYEKLRLLSLNVIDSKSYSESNRDSRGWRSIGQDKLVKELAKTYVPAEDLSSDQLEGNSQQENEKWLRAYLGPVWRKRTEVWLLEGADHDSMFVASAMQLHSRLRPYSSQDRGPLIIFENWKKGELPSAASSVGALPIPIGASKPGYSNPFSASPSNESSFEDDDEPAGNPDDGGQGGDQKRSEPKVLIQLKGHKDQTVVRQFVEMWLSEHNCEDLKQNTEHLSRVLHTFAGGHLGSLRLVLEAIEQAFDATDEDTIALTTSKDDQSLHEAIKYCIAVLDDSGGNVAAYVRSLVASFDFSRDIDSTSPKTKVREKDGLIIEKDGVKRWIELIDEYLLDQGVDPPPSIDPDTAAIIASLPPLFEWFRLGAQGVTGEVGEAFGAILQHQIYKRFEEKAQAQPPAEYQAIAVQTVNTSTPADAKALVQDMKRAAIQILGNPHYFSRDDLQQMWQAYRRLSTTDDFDTIWQRSDYSQAGAAEKLVLETFRAKTFPQLLNDVLAAE